MGDRSISEPAGDAQARRSILECLAGAEVPLGALEVARRTHLSTLVAIPALTRLADEALVRRRRMVTGSGRRDVTWAYELTGRGLQAAGPRATRRTG